MSMCEHENKVGGLTDAKPVDDTVKDLVNQLQKDVESKTGKEYATFVPVSYKSQVVAGVNYFVKVKVGDEDFIHVRIYKPLEGQGETTVSAVQEGKKEGDDIEYFD